MKSTKILAFSALASAIMASAGAYASTTEGTTVFLDYGGTQINEVKANEGTVIGFEHSLSSDYYLKGSLGDYELDENDGLESGTLDTQEIGGGVTIKSHNMFKTTYNLGAGIFEHDYDMTVATGDNFKSSADGFYIEAGFKAETMIKNLGVNGSLQKYIGDSETSIYGTSVTEDYDFMVANLGVEYSINRNVDVTADASFSDGESAFKVGINFNLL